MLDRQISLFKVDTDAFLSEEEKEHRAYLRKLKHLKKYINDLYQKKDISDHLAIRCENWIEYLEPTVSQAEKDYKSWLLEHSAEAVEYNINNPDNKRIRQLDEKYLWYTDKYDGSKKVNLTNVISMFESTLSRSFGIQVDELTYDIFVLEIYYYDVAKDLILNGFDYNGKHYIYFSSSAGQIRTKKAVFVNEEKFKDCEMKLCCGLTLDKINEQGGMNVN